MAEQWLRAVALEGLRINPQVKFTKELQSTLMSEALKILTAKTFEGQELSPTGVAALTELYDSFKNQSTGLTAFLEAFKKQKESRNIPEQPWYEAAFYLFAIAILGSNLDSLEVSFGSSIRATQLYLRAKDLLQRQTKQILIGQTYAAQA
jgi:hypothetical protein